MIAKIFENEYTPVGGDIILIRSNNLLARAIRFFMRLSKWIRGKKPTDLFNHSAMIVELYGSIYVAEALIDGINVTPYDKTYGRPIYKYKRIKRIVPRYSFDEAVSISRVAVKSALVVTRYDFFSYIGHIRKALTGKWAGKTGDKASNRMACTEAVGTWTNSVRPGVFPEPWSTNPNDIDENESFDTFDVYNNG